VGGGHPLSWTGEKNRISLSLRSKLPDPWERIATEFPEGSSFTGQVARLMKFGAFVTLIPGVDGLIHISKLGRGKRDYPSLWKCWRRGRALPYGSRRSIGMPNASRLRCSMTMRRRRRRNWRISSKYVGKAPGSFGSLGDAPPEEARRR